MGGGTVKGTHMAVVVHPLFPVIINPDLIWVGDGGDGEGALVFGGQLVGGG